MVTALAAAPLATSTGTRIGAGFIVCAEIKMVAAHAADVSGAVRKIAAVCLAKFALA